MFCWFVLVISLVQNVYCLVSCFNFSFVYFLLNNKAISCSALYVVVPEEGLDDRKKFVYFYCFIKMDIHNKQLLFVKFTLLKTYLNTRSCTSDKEYHYKII